jgi:pimeloyl-ACP methyl ester carboxylesterase
MRSPPMPFVAGIYYSTNEGPRREKPVVVLIHDMGGNHQGWPSDLRHLPGYRVIVPDLPGHGKSSGTGLQSIWGYADHLIGFLAELGLYKAVFIGHSMGGCIALALGLKYPDQVIGLGLISCGAHMDLPMDILENITGPATLHLALDALKYLNSSPARLVGTEERINRPFLDTRPGVLYGDLLACTHFDVVDQLEEIQAPTFVLSGYDDRLVPPNNAQFLETHLENNPKASGNNKFLLVPSAGHNILIEHTQTVKRTITSFLGTICPG